MTCHSDTQIQVALLIRGDYWVNFNYCIITVLHDRLFTVPYFFREIVEALLTFKCTEGDRRRGL